MNMAVNIAGVEWKNPVTTASGTFGSGEEFSEFVDLNRLGAVTTKGVANVPWPGNPTPRVAEVYGGMMNAIGLQNPGIDLFCNRDIPFLRKYLLSECQRGRYRIWSESKGGGKYYQSSEKIRETAGYHEAESECDRYYRDGKSRRGRWS